MTSRSSAAGQGRALLLTAALLLALRQPVAAQSALPAGLVRLPGAARSSSRIAQARALGRLEAAAPVRLTLALPARDPAGLSDLLRHLYAPQDPLYGKYLTPAEFADRFGPTSADYQAVAAYARSQGLTVVGTHANRLLLDVAAPARTVEAAFRVTLQKYQLADGNVVHAADAAPAVPAAIAGHLAGVFGLDSSPAARPQRVRLTGNAKSRAQAVSGPGTGPGGGLTPYDVRAAYGLDGVTLDGTGQTMAVLELDGYTASDIQAYQNQFGLPHVAQEVVPVNLSAPLTPGSGADEATLDIELLTALAPRAAKVLVYESANDDADLLDNYSRIANDDRAREVCTCWGLDQADFESGDPGYLSTENTIFQQMATQGQTIFAASGDYGAYDVGTLQAGLAVDDPASQPYVTGVGGTTLTTYSSGGAWQSETTYNDGPITTGASGGGISGFSGGSQYWPIPSYQQGVISAASLGSTTMRNVPDVSLNADQDTGYAIYYQGGWVVYGGTSTATPLWAGFAALVNQQRLATGQGYLGFANPAIYSLGQSAASYARDFHDVADDSNNGYYPAVTGYDLATGWGSFQGANLLADLTASAQPSALAAPFTLPAGLNFFSLPDTYSGSSLNGLFGEAYSYFAWNPIQGQYTTSTAPTAQAGRGYWANLPQGITVNQTGTPVTVTAPITLSLAAGWNQIGDPFPYSIAVENLQAVSGNGTYPLTSATGASLVYGVLYRYDTAAGRYVSVTSLGGALTPTVGEWIYAWQPVSLQIPPP